MKYRITLCPAKPAFKGSLKKYKKLFNEAKEAFNEDSKNDKNPKSINIISLEDDIITLDLITESEVDVPTKALRNFSKELKKSEEFRNELDYNGSFFKSTRVSTQTPKVSPSSSDTSVEVTVMGRLTALLTGEDTNKDEFFRIINSLFAKTEGMTTGSRSAFLTSIDELINAEAEKIGR